MAREQTVEDYVSLTKYSGIVHAGDLIAYTATPNHKEKDREAASEVVFAGKDGSVLRKYGSEEKRCYMPAFSVDGLKYAFIEEENGSAFLVSGFTSTWTQEKVVLESKPEQIAFSGDSLLILMKERESEEKAVARKSGDDGYFFEEDDRFSSVYRYSPGNGFEKVTDGIQVWEFSVRGNTVAFVGSEYPAEDYWYRSRLYTLEEGQRPHRMLYDPFPRTLARPRISPNGKTVAFLESHWSDRGVTSGDLVTVGTDTGDKTNLTGGMGRSFTDFSWLSDESIHALFIESDQSGISRFDGKWREVWKAQGTVQPRFAPEFAAGDDCFFVAFSNGDTIPEICRIGLDGNMKRVSSFNSYLEECAAYPASNVEWKSSDGTVVNGIIRAKNRGDPLIVSIHGGPTSSSGIEFIDLSTMFLSEGFSVFMPNYRGSTGRGRDFAEANIGDMGGMDMNDILSGIDYLIESGTVSPEHIFITGGSYGGFITNLAVTVTDRFSAAVSLFGISDWESFHGTTNIAIWDTLYYGKSVYSNSEINRYTPSEKADAIKTPLLMMHGVNDPCVPVGQSLELFRKLKDAGKVVRLLLFPREGHGFKESKHIRMEIEESVRWFRKYMSQLNE